MPKLRGLVRRIAIMDSRPFRPPPKTVNPHYHSQEHKRWARAVIRAARGQCQGAAHDSARPRDGVRLFADHVVELADGGAALDPRNGTAL